MKASNVPPLPGSLSALYLYLNRRDQGAPTILPQPGGITSTTPTAGWVFDILTWEYPVPNVLRGELSADAFVIWWEDASTNDPLYCAATLPISARRWGQFMPTASIRSYAISAVRWCHTGPHESIKQQAGAWRNVT